MKLIPRRIKNHLRHVQQEVSFYHIDLKGTEEEETALNPGSVVESQTSSFADCVVAAFARWVRRTTDRHFSGVFTR